MARTKTKLKASMKQNKGGGFTTKIKMSGDYEMSMTLLGEIISDFVGASEVAGKKDTLSKITKIVEQNLTKEA